MPDLEEGKGSRLTEVDPSLSDRIDPVLDLLNERPREDWQWSFQPEAVGHSEVNAVALCNAALLAYSEQAGVQRFLSNWGFDDTYRFLRGFRTQGFIARKDDAVIIAFRGTEPTNAADWLSDVSYHQQRLLPSVPGFVHGGFARAIEEIMQQMLDTVEELSGDGEPPLYVTGHSLGGALAVLAAAVLELQVSRNVAAVYTYGQPRVGDPLFSSTFDQRLGTVTFRYVNDLDVVPHLPPVQLPDRPALPTVSLTDLLGTIEHAPLEVRRALAAIIEGEKFSHVGQLKLFLPDGTLTSDDEQWQEREFFYSGRLEDLFRNLPSLFQAKLREILLSANRFRDHDPLNGYLPKLEAQLG